ncbi:MAG: cell wall protein [Finegoldia magna]|uniref:adhesion factor FAF n=1 Tax=Finegoldia magna TaxID=1260 RepID=UPI00242A9DB3|nr:adhesion factor FAF [Finegoldia magna]MBS5971791.1 cell wall protein [Finegoldia magna]
MKLNKKLLTAALAGALVVTAVPAGTFAEKNSKENSYTEELNLTKQQAAARMDQLAKKIAELSARRAAIVTQEWKAGETSEGLIEKLQKEEAAAKKAYEAAKANFEAAAKAWEQAKDAQEKARLAKRKALDAYDAKVGEYNKLVKEAEAARDAAKKEAKEKFEDTIASSNRKYEVAQTNLDRAENELAAAKKALETIADDEDENVPEGTKAQYDQAKKAVLELEAKVAQLKIERTKAHDEKITVKDTAKENLEKANDQADTLFQAKIQELNKKYKLNDNYGDAAAELTLIERAKLKAIKDYDNAKANAEAAFGNYVAANKAYEAASKAYAKANQRAYKVTEELKSIEKQLKENYVRINIILKDQNQGINSLAGKLDSDMIKEIENFAELSKSEQAAAIAKLQKELNKLKEEYDKTKDEIKEVKSVYTYKFAVKDTTGKGVQGLSLTFTNIEDSTKVYVGTSDENGDIVVKGIAEGAYKIAVTHVPTGYKVVQKGKMVSEVKGLFRPEAEVKAENNAKEATAEKKKATVEIPEIVIIKGGKEDKKDEKEDKKDEKVIDGGTIVVEKEKDNKDNKDEKDNKDNKKPEKEEKENNKKPAKPAKPAKQQLPKAGAAAEAATIAAAAMATMGGAYLSLKKRK